MAKKNATTNQPTNQPTPADALEEYRQLVIATANDPDQPVDGERLADLLYLTGRTQAHFRADVARYLARKRAVDARRRHAAAKAALPAVKAKHDRLHAEFAPIRAKIHAEVQQILQQRLREAGGDLDAVAGEMIRLEQDIASASADMVAGGPIEPGWVAKIRSLENQLNALIQRQTDLEDAAHAADGLRESLATFKGLRRGTTPPPWHPVLRWTDQDRIRDAYYRGVLSQDERASAIKYITDAEAKATKAAAALAEIPGLIGEKQQEIEEARQDALTPEHFALCEGPSEVPGLVVEQEQMFARLEEKFTEEDKTLRAGAPDGDYADDVAELRAMRAGAMG